MSEPLEFEAPTREGELARLGRALRLGRGFRLYFARSLPGPPRTALLGELDAALGGGMRVFDARPGLDHLRAALEAELAGDTPRAVCVTGIETWVPSGAEGAGSAFVRNLNASRDRFASILPCPLVIWGADHVLQAIQHGAPDFFSIASGIYLFPGVTSNEDMTQEYEEIALEDQAFWLRAITESDHRLEAIGDPDTSPLLLDKITTIALKSRALLRLGRYYEAEAVARWALKIAIERFGENDLIALASASNLANILGQTGRYDEAIELATDSLRLLKEFYGDDNIHTLSAANGLAANLQRAGRFTEAFAIQDSSLAARRRVLGNDHPDSLESANNLASLYLLMGLPQQAESLYISALDGRRRALGDDHPLTVQSENNLSHVYFRLGRYAEAEALLRKAIEGQRGLFGPEHPDSLLYMNNLARLYRVTGREEEAIAILESILSASEKLPPENSTRKMIEEIRDLWLGEGSEQRKSKA